MFNKNLAYEASAGSGKTFALVIRYISLLYLDAKPNTILALTFTNKAAKEMSARISQTLAQLETKEAELQEISKSTNLSKNEILLRRESVYKNYLTSDLQISTIDKFFTQILRKFSLNISLMPDFQIDEQNDEQKFIIKFLSQVKSADKYKDLIKFAVIESKKLGSIFTLLDDLYAKDGEIKNIEIPELGKNNEKEIMRLVQRLEELFLSCNQLSPSAKSAIKAQSITDLLNKSWITKDSLNYHYFKKCFTPYADEIFFELKKALQIYYINKDASLKKSYIQLYQIYNKTKQSQNVSQNILSFNDVTNSVFRLLAEHINRDFLYFRLDAKIDHILIDEFQDTNVIQYKILEPILDEISSGIGTKEFKTLFYVGDIKQSIYRFRGGAKELFAHNVETYDVTLEALTTNYRSYAKIVQFINDTFRDKIKDYKDQNFIGDENKGFVKISTSEELLKDISENIFSLIKKGVDKNNIAILTYTNSDAFVIQEALLEIDPNLKIVTQTTSKLINNPTVISIIEFLKYLYFEEEIYKANFLISIGKSWENELDISSFNKNENLLKLVKKIIDKFELYHEDNGVLKFIETILDYNDIESFLFECETLNTQSPAKKDKGIQLLTIHKSKGLEFTHVILCDRFKNKIGDRSTLIFKYQDIDLQNLYIRIKNRDHFDEEYKNALEYEKKLTSEDELNLLYVACTRAKESLTICQSSEKSAFEILNLEDQELGKIKKTASVKEIKIAKELEYKSQKLGLQDQKIKKQQETKENFEAIQFGLGMHYMLEIIEEFEPSFLDDAYWAMKNQFELYLDEKKLEEIKTRVNRLLEYQPFLKLIKGNTQREQSIIYNGELKQIDLLIEHDDNWTIIDYKSSQKRESSHVSQVSNYKNAVEKITKKKVRAYLCYVKKMEIKLVEV